MSDPIQSGPSFPLSAPGFPFSAVLGQDEARLALALATVDPRIGGVLLRGEKGSAKTTLARGLAALLPGAAPFVELPLGASEERVVGAIDLAAALGGGEVRLQPGLLAAAHGGVLYVDEINLLADHLVDVLLDVAVSGINRVERDGISHAHPARFVLVGSMNPEEGDLRPQLLDRFGLAVDVRAPVEVAERAEAVARRLSADSDPGASTARWAESERELARRLAAARPAALGAEVLTACSAVAVEAGAEGLRADLTLARAAAAHAGWDGRTDTTFDDVRRVSPLVLAHRARRQPLDPPGSSTSVDDAVDRALGPEPADGPSGSSEPAAPEEPVVADEPAGVVTLEARRVQADAAAGRRSPVLTDRGRTVGHRPVVGPVGTVDVGASAAVAARRRGDLRREGSGGPLVVERVDLREPIRAARTGNLLVLAVDASGSMGATERMAAVKGALLGLLVDAYQRRDRVALVTFGGAGVEVALRPTGSIEVARTRLEDLRTGGDTPLAEGLRVATDLATQSATATLRPLLVLVTDGRATAGAEPWAEALDAARSVGRRRLPTVVVDVEAPGPGALGLARELAAALDGRHVPLPVLTSGRLESALRGL